MADLVDDIKSRLTIEDVVSQYVQLKKAGRNLKGLCPFHSEKTSSFIVSPEKQICHCFGCNKGGDIFTFIQEIEGITFVESLELLSDRAGIKADLSKYQKKATKSEKDDYYKAHELATEFFEKQLYKTDDGKKVLEYLHKRGLNDETIKEFRIGFAPDKYDELYPLLLKKGISKEVLINSGLVSSKKLTSDEVYDKYRARLMFPILNYLGR
ncbi:MAG: CHC2 zinc finger domain-containing protein, partial [bacterium]|nr:CHC2 zinc finger domain-containing protein [bacterium]